MKLLRLVTTSSLACSFLLSVCVAVSAQPRSAQPRSPLNDCSSASSMIVAPDGTCYNLSYLTILGNARSNLSAANSLYNQALNLNVSTGKATTYTYDVGRGKSISNTYSDNPTEEEKKARQELLQATSQNLDNQSKKSGDIESAVFMIHTHVMGRLNGVFAGRSR